MNDRWVAGSAFLAGITFGVLGLYLLGYRPTTPSPAPVQPSSPGFTASPPSERSLSVRSGEQLGLGRDSLSLGNLSLPQLEQLAQLYQTASRDFDLSAPSVNTPPPAFTPTATLPPPSHAPLPPTEPQPMPNPYVVPHQEPAVIAPFPPLPIPKQWRFIRQ